MNVIDVAPLFEARRRRAQASTVRTYHAILVQDLTPGELVHRLRGTGLVINNRHDTLVLHDTTEPPPAA